MDRTHLKTLTRRAERVEQRVQDLETSAWNSPEELKKAYRRELKNLRDWGL